MAKKAHQRDRFQPEESAQPAAASGVTSILDDLLAEMAADHAKLEFPFRGGGLEIENIQHLDNKIAQWRTDFLQFVTECLWFPFGNKPERVTLQPYHEEVVQWLYDPGILTILLCWPKRHGKTLFNAMIGIWRLVCFPQQKIAVLSTSEEHATSTLYGYERDLAMFSPVVRWLCGVQNIHDRAGIWCKYQNSGIRPLSCAVPNVSGRTFTLLQCTELREIRKPEVFRMAHSQTDMQGAKTIVDSSAADEGNPVTEMYELWRSKGDATLAVSYFHGENKAPWISDAWLHSRKLQLPPALYRQWHENEFGATTEPLIPLEMIHAIEGDYPETWTMADVRMMLQKLKAIAYTISGGIDRSAPWTDPSNSDATVLTVTMRVLVPSEQPQWISSDDLSQHVREEFFVLRQNVLRVKDDSTLKRLIQNAHQEYFMGCLVMASYQAGDIYLWARSQGINTYLTHESGVHQMQAFGLLHSICEQKALHCSNRLTRLLDELKRFKHRVEGARVIFGTEKKAGARSNGQRVRDDTVYSLAWSLVGHQYCQPVGMRSVFLIGDDEEELADTAFVAR